MIFSFEMLDVDPNGVDISDICPAISWEHNVDVDGIAAKLRWCRYVAKENIYVANLDFFGKLGISLENQLIFLKKEGFQHSVFEITPTIGVFEMDAETKEIKKCKVIQLSLVPATKYIYKK
jgi:hypothetical protein